MKHLEANIRKTANYYQDLADEVIADYFEDVIGLATAKTLLEEYLPKAKVARDIYFEFVEVEEREQGDNFSDQIDEKTRPFTPGLGALSKSCEYSDIQKYVESRMLSLFSTGCVYATIFKETKEDFEKSLADAIDIYEVTTSEVNAYVNKTAGTTQYNIRIDLELTDETNFNNRHRFTINSPYFDNKDEAEEYLKHLNLEEVM